MTLLQKLTGLGLLLTILSCPVVAGNLTAEVYRDDNLTIESGIAGLEKQIVHFGDVLTLVVNISYDENSLSIPEIEPEFFTEAWTEAQGAYLLGYQSSRVNGRPSVIRSEFRFQILACPDEKILCRGTRQYMIPEFKLVVQTPGEQDDENPGQTISFQPWPSTVMVASAIPLDEEGQLQPFFVYFPTGGYPDPLAGHDDDTSSRLIAGSLFLLLGGILMSPISFFKSKSSVQKLKTRWEEVLDKLQAGSYGDDAHTMDAIRKCLVWYCLDELEVDPFYWVKHEEELTGKKQKGTDEYEEYKKLFIDVLHNPQGESKALLDRLSSLAVKHG